MMSLHINYHMIKLISFLMMRQSHCYRAYMYKLAVMVSARVRVEPLDNYGVENDIIDSSQRVLLGHFSQSP